LDLQRLHFSRRISDGKGVSGGTGRLGGSSSRQPVTVLRRRDHM